MDPPRVTRDELEIFLDKVELWYKNGTHLSHRLFHPDFINFVSRLGYRFEFQKPRNKPGYYIVVKV